MAWTEEEKNKITWDSGTGWFSGGWFQSWFTRQITIIWIEEIKNEVTWSEE